MKNSFLMYTDWMEMLEELDDAERGVLMLAIMRYQAGQELPEMGVGARVAFAQIRSQFTKDSEKYQEASKKRSEAGRAGGLAKSSNAKQTLAMLSDAKQSLASCSKIKQNVHDNDNVNDNVKDLKDIKTYCADSDAPLPTSRDPKEYPYSEIIDRLNAKAGTKYRSSSDDTRRLIRARIDSGFTLSDFFTVIDKKVAEWKGTEQEKYLRPSTLFGTKFEGYLNQNIIKPTSAPVNRFHNFDQVGYDYDDIVKELNG